MKRVRMTWCVLMVSALVASAGETAKTPEQFLIPKPAKPVVVDGKLDEWDMAGSAYVIDPTGKAPRSEVLPCDATNPPKGEADISGRAALAWDERYLYVAAQMVDDHLMGVRPNSVGNQGPPGWGCDSLMVILYSFRQPMKTNSPYGKIPTLGLRYAPVGVKPRGQLVGGGARVLDKRDAYWVLTRNSKWAVTETARGYNVEAAVPWEDLGFVARPGERLFLYFLAADTDPKEALNQIGWGFTREIKDAPVFRLADRRDVLGILTVSTDAVPTDKAWAVRAEIDALSRTGRLAGVRVRDAKGRTVVKKAIGLDVPAGRTGQAVAEFVAGAVRKPGRYTAELLAGAGAGTVVAREPFDVIAPQPEPPVVRNLPGEIRHMSPDRTVHNAYDEHRRGFYKHGFVKGKEDYLPYIRRHVEPGLKGAAKQAIKGKSKYGYHQAFRCIALYRITQDKEYAILARDIMDYLLDMQNEKGTGWFTFSATTMYRYLAWLKDKNSPLTPKNAEPRYRQMLYKVAAKPPGNLFTEWGTHNRTWHRYCVQKCARLVAEADGKPIDPRVIDYTDWHDKYIGDVGDTDDASAGYHWVFFDAAASIYFHTGDWDAFVKHKGYRRTMARYVDMVSPSGTCVPFGSCSGWPAVGQSMWVYEWMSTLTRDGRYRWTSHRIAEEYYNYLDHRANQYHGPYDTARDNFVKAYLFADDAVKPTPPPGGSRVTWRHPFRKLSLAERRERPGQWHRRMDGTRWIPDKVILSSGTKAADMWAMVELLPNGGHTQHLPGHLIAMLVHDSAMLAGQGYYELTPDFNNLMWIEDLDGLAADPREPTVEVPIFVDDPALTFVRIKTTAYQNLPAVYTRDILFYKNGFMVVKDRVKFESTMKVRLGPCFQTRCLGPQCGENWFNTYFDRLNYTGLGLGRGVQSIRNAAWDLLVYFTPRAGRKHTVKDRFLENVWRNAPIQLRQVWSGMARAGQEITFTSVLLPHVPSITPSQFVTPAPDSKDPPRIEIARDDDHVTVIKAIAEMDPVHKFRYETWVMINDTGDLVGAGPLASDGRVAVVGLDYSGNVRHRVVIGGKVLRFRGKDVSAKARKLKAAALAMPKELLK